MEYGGRIGTSRKILWKGYRWTLAEYLRIIHHLMEIEKGWRGELPY